MKESYRKGLANHPGPESCEGSANTKADLEALTGVHAGFVLSSEIDYFRVPTRSDSSEGNTEAGVMRACGRPCGVADQSMRGTFLCENREALLLPESDSGRAGRKRR